MVAQEGKGRRKRQLPGRRCVSLEAAVGYLLLRNTWRLCSFLTNQTLVFLGVNEWLVSFLFAVKHK